jgi:hypothetical protein
MGIKQIRNFTLISKWGNLPLQIVCTKKTDILGILIFLKTVF